MLTMGSGSLACKMWNACDLSHMHQAKTCYPVDQVLRTRRAQLRHRGWLGTHNFSCILQ